MIPEDLLLRKVLFLKVCELLEKTPSLLGKVTMRMVYYNAEPFKKGRVSLNSEWSTDSCPRRSLMMMAMVMRMFLWMLLLVIKLYVIEEDDNDEPLETSCVSLKSG